MEQLELKIETTKWQIEIDEEAADLISAGMPEDDAAKQAAKNVLKRRRMKNADKGGS